MDIFADDVGGAEGGRDDGGWGGRDDGGRNGGRDGSGADNWLIGGGRAAPELPGYHFQRLLGTGASAQVWLVQDEATGALLAAKCFSAESVERAESARATGADAGPGRHDSFSSGRAAMMQRELRILGNYSHEHLLALHGLVHLQGSWEGGRGLLMDYAPGGSVAALIAARGSLSVGETVTILTPLAQVLGYLHGQGVVHGDVSPGNVLFTAEGKPLLADLGVGRMVGDSAGERMGTPGFAPPEETESRALLDPGTDVFSLAAVGWYCLTGEAPPETAYRIPLSVRLPDVPQELAAALEAGLQETGLHRPSALELGQAIYRSAPALPVDLALAVHPSVLPDLLTRRQVKDRRRPGLRRRPPAPAAIPVAPRPARNRAKARWVGVASAVVVVVLAVAAGVAAWHQDGWPGQSGTAAAGGIAAAGQADPLEAIGLPDGIRDKLRSDDPQLALSGLAWLRSYAFGTGQLPLLEQVNASGSSARTADQEIAGRLAAGRHVLSGLETQILGSARVTDPGAEPAHVTATAVTSGFTEQDDSGAVIRSQPEPATQELEFVLVKESGHWRISQVHAAAPKG